MDSNPAAHFFHQYCTVKSSPKSRVAASAADFEAEQLLQFLPLACYACDASGAITQFNQHALALWGRAPEPGDRFSVTRIFDGHGNPVAPEASPMATVLRTGIAQTHRELIIQPFNGTRLRVLSNVAALRNGSGNVIGAIDVLQDITRRRQLEDARRVAERISACARVASEVTQLKPALLSTLTLLDRLGQDATLSTEARNYAELARLELVRFDTVMKQMAHLAGAA